MPCCARVLIGEEGIGDAATVGWGVVTGGAIGELMGDVIGEVGGGGVWSLDASGELMMCDIYGDGSLSKKE